MNDAPRIRWEWAARGGLNDPEFPCGDDPPDARHANWSATAIGHPTRVASFPPNGYGLFDMAGNVWEFTADLWTVSSMDRSSGTTREDPGRRKESAAAATELRRSIRDSHPAGGAGPHVGFRCAQSLR